MDEGSLAELFEKYDGARDILARFRDRELRLAVEEAVRLCRSAEIILGLARDRLASDTPDAARILVLIERATAKYEAAQPKVKQLDEAFGDIMKQALEMAAKAKTELTKWEDEAERIRHSKKVNDWWCAFLTLGIGCAINHAVNDPRHNYARCMVDESSKLAACLTTLREQSANLYHSVCEYQEKLSTALESTNTAAAFVGDDVKYVGDVRTVLDGAIAAAGECTTSGAAFVGAHTRAAADAGAGRAAALNFPKRAEAVEYAKAHNRKV